ncbi:hypothetical protein Bbelb_110370 [Branchiostoma belcheri]|nr:hypothetical protein Bbelb_110370 [Branchiostoma belcheri]
MSGHVTNPSYFISFVKPAPAKVACGRLPEEHCGDLEREYNADHEWKPARGCKPASGRVQPGQREEFPAQGEASCRPGRNGSVTRRLALQQPLPPDRASRHPEDSDSSLGTQFRVVGTGHLTGSPCTERRDAVALMARFLGEKSLSDNQRFGIGLVVEQPEAYFGERLGCWTISKRETVGQFRVPEVLETVGQSQNLVRKTVRRFYGISLCRCIEVVGQSRSEKRKSLSPRSQQACQQFLYYWPWSVKERGPFQTNLPTGSRHPLFLELQWIKGYLRLLSNTGMMTVYVILVSCIHTCF